MARLLFEGTSITRTTCDTSDIPDSSNTRPVVYQEMTTEETTRTLNRLAKKKACGPDGIPNEILSISSKTLSPILTPFLNRCLQLSHFPATGKAATTAIIRKANKPDYTHPGAYRPIALLNSTSKIFETILTERLTHWAEINHIISEGHMGGRKSKGGKDALLALTIWIKQKWREGKIVAALFLDVKSAYPSVSPDRLINTLQQKGCPTYLWKILQNFLHRRTTNLRLGDYTSESFDLPQGLPQGSPLSVILYIIYNTGLMIPKLSFSQDQISLGFINDVVHLVARPQLHDSIPPSNWKGTGP